MGADLSRVSFDPRRDHSAVLLQQGRLLLDADWNELVAIMDRRIRAGIADLDGPGPAPGVTGVAVVPRTTPDAFRVTLAGGKLTIGRGRMYVDGLLAENHGLEPAVLDPLLDELRGGTDTPYTQQPYWPTPDPLPTSGSHLAYLDVWEREVTHIEAPDLVDPAIAVDTTARRQVVWQVRLHPLGTAAAGCTTPDADLPGWEAVIAPSGARLTAGTIPVDLADDYCELPPTGGYRGLENQTYRVEVHTGGGPGTATFKWSRDNCSVVQPVHEVLAGGTSIRPASFGRDDVLGFADGDWVEITDDHRELDGQPGEMRRIEVHEEDGTCTFAPALPPDLVLTAAQARTRHLRVRRWDQRGQVRSGAGAKLDDLDAPGATGTITVPASASTTVVLEHGLVVGFASAGSPFRVGDHWIFSARAADPDAPLPQAAPPSGVHHHFARLGILTLPDAETDCRTPWPSTCDCGDDHGGCGDCSVCVTPESHASGALTVQAAVDEVAAAGGGSVCLGPGAYHLDQGGVVLDGVASVRLRGQGLRTVIFAGARGIQVRRSAFITVQDLTVVSTGADSGITLDGTASVTVQTVTLLTLAVRDRRAPAIGLSGVALLTVIRDCVVVAPVGIAAGAGERRPGLLTANLHIADNVLLCRDRGVDLSGRVAHVLGVDVTSNTVIRAGETGLLLTGAVAPAHGCTVAGNTVHVGGVGIAVSPSGCSVADNAVTGTADGVEARSDGIVVVQSSFGELRGPTDITGNTVQAVGGRGIGVLAPVASLRISGNTVGRAQHGILMAERARAEVATVSDNVVVDVGTRESDADAAITGIQVVGALRATVESNVVHGVGNAVDGVGDECTGIDVLACVESRVAGNSVDRIGFPEQGRRDLGIGVRGGLLRAQVTGNAVRRQPADVDEDGPSQFVGLLVGSGRDPHEVGVEAVRGYSLGTGEATFVVGSKAGYWTQLRPATVTVDTNIVSGGGDAPSALVGVAGEVVTTGNQLHARLRASAPALHVLSLAASVSTNRFRGGEPSAHLDVDPDRLAVVGNLSSSAIVVFGGALDPRWDPLNPSGV